VKGCVVWLTGLPAAGKSTLAEKVRDRLVQDRRAVVVLDGDSVRAALVPPPGYDAAGREVFHATLAQLAALLAHQGLVVLVAATAHRRAWRDRARRLAPNFVEVFVDSSAEECQARDPRGLYAAAREGKAPQTPGARVAYEPPTAPDVVASGGLDPTALDTAVALVERLQRTC
jgi:adenylylsulfate kinase